MADIGTGFVALIGFAAVALPRETSILARCFLGGLLSVLISLHLSHILLASSLLAVATLVMAVRRMPFREIAARCWPVFGAIILATLVLSAINLAARGRFVPSVSSDTFLLARLFDGRLAQPVLVSNCRQERLLLCSELALVTDPTSKKPGQDFLWKKGAKAWTWAETHPVAVHAEQRMLIRETIMADPEAAVELALRGWGEQIVRVRNGQIGQYPPEYESYRQIAKHLPGEVAQMRRSLQQTGRLYLIWTGWDVALALTLLVLSPFLIWLALRLDNPILAGLGITALATTIINAAITGVLSGPDDRYQGRIAWLLPLFAILTAIEYYRNRSKTQFR